MKEQTSGERAYDLAVRAVGLATRVDPVPILDGHPQSPLGESGRYRHSFGAVTITADFDKTSARTEWRAVVEADGACVLDVVYDTNPSAGQCEIVTVVAGPWEELMDVEEARVAAATAGRPVF